MNDETQKKMQELSSLENTSNQITAQKQNLQTQILEIDSALSELKSSKEVYKIIANVMVKSSEDALSQALTKRKEVINSRLKSLDAQEQKIAQRAQELHSQIMEDLKGGEDES